MKTADKTLPLKLTEAEDALAGFIRSYDHLSGGTLKQYRGAVRHFLTFIADPSGSHDPVIRLDSGRAIEWMTREAHRVTPGGLATKYRTVRSFLRTLVAAGRIEDDPTEPLHARLAPYDNWAKIARALRAEDREAALDAIRPEPPFRSVVGDHLRAYLDLKRSLGARYRTEEGTLASFDRFLQHHAVPSSDAITPEIVEAWLQSMSCGPITRTHKLRLIARFFTYLEGLGLTEGNLAGHIVRRQGRLPPASFRPYIFSKDEVAALLREAKRLPPHRLSPLRAQTCHGILALLYGLGLRRAEACRLRVKDLDLTASTLWIHQTKFHKSRVLPFGPKLRACLAEYLDARATVFPPLRSGDPLFVASGRRPIHTETVHRNFLGLLQATGICPTGRRRPRLHDLRHSFATHRLLRWYREGVDVQTRLARLSTFLGHVSIHSTQVYLSITDDLLDAANGRFWRRFGSLLDN